MDLFYDRSSESYVFWWPWQCNYYGHTTWSELTVLNIMAHFACWEIYEQNGIWTYAMRLNHNRHWYAGTNHVRCPHAMVSLNITTKTFVVSNSDDVTHGCFSTFLTVPLSPSLTKCWIRPQAFPSREINYDLPGKVETHLRVIVPCTWMKTDILLASWRTALTEPGGRMGYVCICRASRATSKWNLPKMARKNIHFHNDVILSLPQLPMQISVWCNTCLGWLIKWLYLDCMDRW